MLERDVLQLKGGSRFERYRFGGDQPVMRAERQPRIDEGPANSMFSFSSIFPIGTGPGQDLWLRSSPCPQYRDEEMRPQLCDWVGSWAGCLLPPLPVLKTTEFSLF